MQIWYWWIGVWVEQELSRHKMWGMKMGHWLRKKGGGGIYAYARPWWSQVSWGVLQHGWCMCFQWVGSDSAPCVWLYLSKISVGGPTSINDNALELTSYISHLLVLHRHMPLWVLDTILQWKQMRNPCSLCWFVKKMCFFSSLHVSLWMLLAKSMDFPSKLRLARPPLMYNHF